MSEFKVCVNCEEHVSDLEPCMFYPDEYMVCGACSTFWECIQCDMHVCEKVATNNNETFGECEECFEKCCVEHYKYCTNDECTKYSLCERCIGTCHKCEDDFCMTHLPYECRVCEVRFCDDDCDGLLSCICGGISDYCIDCADEIVNYCEVCGWYCDDCEHDCEASDESDCEHDCESSDESVVNITQNFAQIQLDDENGVYCVLMKAIVTKASGTHDIRFLVDGIENDNYMFIKFGRSNSFATRFTQLNYEVIFVRDLKTSAEKHFLDTFEENAFQTTFHRRSSVKTIQKDLRLGGSPALTEWRIVTKGWLARMRALSSTMSIETYETDSTNFRNSQNNILWETGRLTVCVGTYYRRANESAVSVHDV